MFIPCASIVFKHKVATALLLLQSFCATYQIERVEAERNLADIAAENCPEIIIKYSTPPLLSGQITISDRMCF